MDVPELLGIPEYDFRLIFGFTKLEYGPEKEKTNRKSHKYSLGSAMYIFERLIILGCNAIPYIASEPFTEKGEVRHMHLTVDDCGHVVLIVTTMRADETVRVISFRRADESEREIFRRHTGYAKPRNVRRGLGGANG